jgi:hypothetical protein
MSVTVISPPAARRAAVLQGLANLAAFIETHDLPLGNHDPLRYCVRLGSDDANRAEVERVAEILGDMAAESADGTHLSTWREFGGGIRYSAFTITAAEGDRYRQRMAGFYAREGAAA